MTGIAEHLEQVAARLRGEQQAMTRAILSLALAMPTRNVRAVAVDAARGSVVLVIDDLIVRVAIKRSAQAGELQRMHRTAPTELMYGAMLDGGRVLLAFSDGERLVPLVGEAITPVTTL